MDYGMPCKMPASIFIMNSKNHENPVSNDQSLS